MQQHYSSPTEDVEEERIDEEATDEEDPLVLILNDFFAFLFFA